MPVVVKQTIRFAELGAKLKEARKVVWSTKLLDEIGKGYVAFIKHKFTSTSQKKNRNWPPLAPNTVAAKGHNRILVDSGLLWHSFEHKVLPGARVKVWTDVPWAKYHEFGTRGPYRIGSKKGKLLSFITVGGRVWVKEVMHPGLPVRKMLPTHEQAALFAQVAITQAVGAALRKKQHGSD